MSHRLSLVLLAGLVAGCAAVSDLAGGGGPRNVPPEYRQLKVGLFAHGEAEQFYYPGSASRDVSDLMQFHLQQTLPFTSQAAFQEIFKEVELKEPDPKIQFKTEDLAGYFEIRISSVRYDWPDSRATKFRADVELVVEFKSMGDEVLWRGVFQGEGIGFSDENIRLTRYGREAATALEDAFQNAVYEMQDAVLESPTLRSYFRWFLTHRSGDSPPDRGQSP